LLNKNWVFSTCKQDNSVYATRLPLKQEVRLYSHQNNNEERDQKRPRLKRCRSRCSDFKLDTFHKKILPTTGFDDTVWTGTTIAILTCTVRMRVARSKGFIATAEKNAVWRRTAITCQMGTRRMSRARTGRTIATIEKYSHISGTAVASQIHAFGSCRA
jgi:hypothetical protein